VQAKCRDNLAKLRNLATRFLTRLLAFAWSGYCYCNIRDYIEANESLSKKDFLMRIKICRKEAKESQYWLMLLKPPEGLAHEAGRLAQESCELMKIFGAIITKSEILNPKS
jgi:hypothetical protein